MEVRGQYWIIKLCRGTEKLCVEDWWECEQWYEKLGLFRIL